MLCLDGKEEEYLVAALLEVEGDDIDARESGGHLDAETVALAGADRVDEVFVVKGNEQIVALVVDLDLLVGRASGGVCHDLENVALGVETNGSTVASDDPFLGNDSGTLECAEQTVAVDVDEDLVCLEDDAVVIDVLALDQTGVEGHIIEIADEVLAAHMHHNSVLLAVGEHTVELLNRLCGNDVGIFYCNLILGTVDDISFSGAFCHLEAVAGNDHDLVSLDLEICAVEDMSLIVYSHSKGHLCDHLLEKSARDIVAESVVVDLRDSGEALGVEGGHLLSRLTRNECSLKLLVYGNSDLLAVHNLKHLEELISVDGVATGLEDGSLAFNSDSLLEVKGGKNDLAGVLGIHMDAFDLGEGTFIRNCAEKGSDTVYELLAVKDNLHFKFSLKYHMCGTFPQQKILLSFSLALAR